MLKQYLGLDIGTTTVSAAVLAEDRVIASRTVANGAFLPGTKWQDVGIIRERALAVVRELIEEYPDIAAIGLTGQMHGILYVNSRGEAVSPLYTWQDGSGDLPYRDGLTYSGFLRQFSPVATGYGLVTHYYHLQNGTVATDAAKLCTVQDYLGMVLCSNTEPNMDASDGASLGFFDLKNGCFDEETLKMLGIDPRILPEIASDPLIGYHQGIPVYAAIGDNQASFLGAAGGQREIMLANVGTGSQFSAWTQEFLECDGLETRPFPGGGYLLVGAPLCGGRAYALLEKFFRDVVEAITGEAPSNCFEAMTAMLSTEEPDDLPVIHPQFQGTRQDPGIRGRIENLSTDNFTPRHLTWAMVEGMAGELRALAQQYFDGGGKPAKLIGSGNGLRKNPALQNCVSRAFGQTLTMSPFTEEAAAGAAIFAKQNLEVAL